MITNHKTSFKVLKRAGSIAFLMNCDGRLQDSYKYFIFFKNWPELANNLYGTPGQVVHAERRCRKMFGLYCTSKNNKYRTTKHLMQCLGRTYTRKNEKIHIIIPKTELTANFNYTLKDVDEIIAAIRLSRKNIQLHIW